MKLDEMDLTDPDFFASWRSAQAAFRVSRAEAPVYWHERKPGQGFWVVSSYADALKGLPRSDDLQLRTRHLAAVSSRAEPKTAAPASA